MVNELKKTIETEFNISVWSCNVSSWPPVGALNLHIRFQSKFNVPVHPDSQLWFAFEFEGRGYTFPRMPQGYRETSTIYNDAFRTLEPLALTEGTALQYIGDLMVCSAKQTRLNSWNIWLHRVTKPACLNCSLSNRKLPFWDMTSLQGGGLSLPNGYE